MRKFLLTYFLIFFALITFSQKKINAVYINKKIVIDGLLNEWKDAIWYDDFIQFEPYNGKPATLKTQVAVYFSDNALYIAAKCFYDKNTKIFKNLSARDDFGDADYFGFLIDPYNTGLTAFGFYLTTTGNQIDKKHSNGKDDYDWDAIWYGKTLVQDTVVFYEFKIPYYSLRFSERNTLWRINFFRNIQQTREIDTWNYIDNSQNGILNQMGLITGLKNIKNKNALLLFPHASAIYQKYTNSPEYATSFIGGMDIKYTIDKSFTLDMMLIPDFGEITSDDKILNLSPFEIQYPEKRPFFTEGKEIFEKGKIFYSRRIGKTPDLYSQVPEMIGENEVIIKNPSQSQILNATKFSGKTSDGLGIGVLNAFTGTTYAHILDTISGKQRTIITQSPVNYNIVAVSQPLPNSSYISITNTNMSIPQKNYISNVTAFESSVRDKQNKYRGFVRYAISQIYNDTLVPKIGYWLVSSFQKSKGNFRFGFSNQIISDTYDHNDMGLMPANNIIDYNLFFAYNIYKPFGKFRQMFNTISLKQSYIYDSAKYYRTNIIVSSRIKTLKYTTYGLTLELSPDNTYDYFEPRIEDRFFIKPPQQNITFYVSTNYAKTLAFDLKLKGYFTSFEEKSQKGFFYLIAPRLRVSKRLLATFSHSYQFDYNNYGFVKKINDDTAIFGQRNIYIQENSFKLEFYITNKLSLNLKLRHYWTIIDYFKYFMLQNNGILLQVPLIYKYVENRDLNFNIFTGDFIFTWRFAPASELNFIIKKSISSSSQKLIFDYYDNFENLYYHSPHLNHFSVKLVYYIDYQKFKRH